MSEALDTGPIREREAKATSGPWRPCARGLDATANGVQTLQCAGVAETVGHVSQDVEADALFIAHSRQDIPALLAEIDRLKREGFRPTWSSS